MGENPNMVVLIATHKRPGLLERTLASLAGCIKPGNYRETVVVENGGKSGAEEVAEKFRDELNTRYMYEKEANKSIALNRALETLNNVLVFFTDDDISFDENILIEYSNAADGINKGVFWGGPVIPEYEEEPVEHQLKYLPFSAKGWNLGPEIQEVSSPVFLGFNWAAFSDDIKALGGFNPYFGPGSLTGGTGQETEMQRVLLEHSIKGVYLPGAKTWHYVPAETLTDEWIFNRNYRTRITKGINMDERPTFFGIPRELIKEWFVIRYHLLYQKSRGTEKGLFWARLYKHRVKGLIKGYRLRGQVRGLNDK